MLGPIDHVGYLVSDLEAGIETMRSRFDLVDVRRFERPQYSLAGAYLGRRGEVEVFTFTEAQLLRERLVATEPQLDHVAHEVADIAAVAAALRLRGVRFSGPDLRGELTEPADLGGVLHLWTLPQTCGGISLQLMQRLAPGPLLIP